VAAKKDRGSELTDLKSQIKNKAPAKVYLFSGNEPFLVDYYVGEIKKIVLEKDEEGLNYSIFENRVDIDALIDACDTFPVFADKKLVLVKNSSLFINKAKKESDSDGTAAGNKSQEVLKQYIPELPDTACLVFIENQIDKRLGLYKQIVKHGLALEFNQLTERELVPWVVKGFRTMGKTISVEAAQHLVAVSEPDMYALKNEMIKLDAYLGERKEITLEDIKLLSIPTIKSVIFDLLDAVAQQNAPRALALLKDMLEIKEPEQKILSMLSKQTGEILKLKCLQNKGATQADIGSYFQGKHPYALKIMMNQARKMDEGYLRKLLKSCAEAETSYKKGAIGARLSLEVLLSKISG